MKNFFFLSLMLIFFSCGGSPSNQTTSTLKGSILFAYNYNSTLWQSIESAPSGNKTIFVVVNPDDGPGTQTDPLYSNFINELTKTEKIPLAYIYTNYAQRDITSVEADVNAWLELYPEIKGFFFDEVSDSEEDLPYYEELENYVKAKGNYYIVLNPGTNVPESYFEISDAVITYEDSAENTGNYVPPPFYSKNACVIYGVSDNLWKEVFNEFKTKCAYLFITNGTLPNPYSELPDYFEEEIKSIEEN
ncbi:Spherulation-specific family 4 [Desulfurobacterium pacificum]|uniref:Spherulation-specific family 4 n=1 Tax=Desulfurobacterium pacificum TaxID=240166 RepID=A0ABY1NG32_9BACT|nr:spherulation-specific family 4 protein [Desulfurobacterium pacificum]SMP08212.1 Spherulation-specific family 4 [Desulfurobacterium pacificum]